VRFVRQVKRWFCTHFYQIVKSLVLHEKKDNSNCIKERTLLVSTIHNGVIALIHERVFTGPAVCTTQ
jgi:hypothetical protein